MRIISLAPSNTEILYNLGCEDELIAVTRFCDFPVEAKLKPKIGGWLDLDYALIKKLRPDFVITSTFVQNKILAELKKLKINVFHTDPKTLNQVYESIIGIGKLVGKLSEAKQIVNNMKFKFSQIRIQNFELKNTNLKSQIKCYCEEWHKPPTVSGNWVPKIIEFAGGISLAPEGKISYQVTSEDVMRFNPDCIVISLCGLGDKANSEIIVKRSGWESIKGIKEKKVFVINDSLLNRPSPRLVEGAKFLKDLFSKISI